MPIKVSGLAAAAAIAILLGSGACGDTPATPLEPAPSHAADAAVDALPPPDPPMQDAAAPIDAPIDAGSGADAGLPRLIACLDRPIDLPLPPLDQLPCELVPPSGL